MNKLICILHLEDDNNDAELVQAMFASAGVNCQITRVQTGDEFRKTLHQQKFDIILADYRLPGYDGISALQLAQEVCPDIPFIFVSGTMGEDAAIEGLTEGATDYVLKNKLSRLTSATKRALVDAENKRERRRAEETLRESEARFRVVANSANDGIISTDRQGTIFYWNKAAHLMFGYTDDEILGQSLTLVLPEYHREGHQQDVIKLWLTDCEKRSLSKTIEATGRRKDDSEFPVEVSLGSWDTREGTFFTGIVRDITERKHHEIEREAIITMSNAIRKATTRTEILAVILDQLIGLFEADGAMLVIPETSTGNSIVEMGRGVIGERFTGLSISSSKGTNCWAIENKQPYLNNQAHLDPCFNQSGLLGDSHCVASVPLITQEQAVGAIWVAREHDLHEPDVRLLNAIADIAANAIYRVTLYEQTVRQLHRLLALHEIDVAITTNFDLKVTLDVILNNVRNELEVDATSVLLFAPGTGMLNYAAGVGFNTSNITLSQVPLGKGLAGRAASELHIACEPDLAQTTGSFSRSILLADEGFSSHFAAPLIAKGQLKGVLEIFHREPLTPTQEWLHYFDTLATQAAIAIEGATLFENLQRSNAELTLAYDATIEGWSRALDLRDQETEEHAQRVVDMSMLLAEKMGMNDMEKLNLRRGALLHDIGKMGIPDAILQKPGPLTEDEWEIMRQHPVHAYNMLKPIAYLRQVLDVPYCHHEKWDGSGYPRGLKGEEIPLAARIFAIVDVFDALVVDRPYRHAWSQNAILDYIGEQSGKQFDPAVVQAFLEMMASMSC